MLIGQRFLLRCSLVAFATAATLALVRIHARLEVTALGYRIGKLKDEERDLMEQRGRLTVALAKVSSRASLERLAYGTSRKKP